MSLISFLERVWTRAGEIASPVTKPIMKIIEPIGKVVQANVNFFLLLTVYLSGVGITAITAKLFGKSFLDLGKKKKGSYYNDIDVKKQDLEEYYKMF